jgi:hypothetical protein
MESLVRHLHSFAKVRLSQAEWAAAIELLISAAASSMQKPSRL